MTDTKPDRVEAFIARWTKAGGSERANYQLFLTELTEVLDLPKPDPASDDTRDNAYVFERRVTFRYGDGNESAGFIDLYRRGAFVCEAKKVRLNQQTKGFDDALLRARSQAEDYARALPASEGRPPLLLVVDVGNVIELYSEFSRSGATYTPFPDPRSHRIKLTDLRNEEIRERLKLAWLDPLALDPSRQSAKVTREIAMQLANIAKTLEGAKYEPQQVAGFLTRCLFTFFAEDVGLLPKRAFADLLESLAAKPAHFVPLVTELWRAMDSGQFSTSIRADVLHFNGKLFKQPDVLPLDRDQIGLLIGAANADWKQVEPAIFGTLLERALNPEVRHALGAHYTPRAYVERLVFPTIIEPLREEWKTAQAAALTLAAEGNLKEAEKQIRAFHHRLCNLRVLDPACGSGNFLYVTMEHLKRLEGEVLNQLTDLGVSMSLETEGLTVDPHQFLGIELNPRAAAVAEMVLWIGYLQWHFRTRGDAAPPQPVLRDFKNIECRDAVLAYDKVEYVLNEHGKPVTRWDGKTTKRHAVTGEDVPDEKAVVPVERYVNPRKAKWPAADFVVGNPPFIGNKRMRSALGDGYVDALRAVWTDVPDTADFVMYWWHNAAEKVRYGTISQFGLITTNSLTMAFNRKLVEHQLHGIPPISLIFAIPDHPWVDNADGAAVRIAMTVGKKGAYSGRSLRVLAEETKPDGEVGVTLRGEIGTIHPDLRIGADVSSARALLANVGLSFMGVILVGSGFIVSNDDPLLVEAPDALKRYLNGRDLAQKSRDCYVIDFYGLSEDAARARFPAAFQRALNLVKPERDHVKRESHRREWWLFGEKRPAMRMALTGLARYIGTTETAKHRIFVFIDGEFLPDQKIRVVAHDDAAVLGILSSHIHVAWALATGARLGVGNDPVYNNTRCFEPFPFPIANNVSISRIRAVAEELDSHRKRQQVAHPEITITGMYNVLEKLRSAETLNVKDIVIHEQGLVSILKQIHDELDLAVLDAYGWLDLKSLMQVTNGNAAPGSSGTPNSRDDAKRLLDETLLERLVALNAERAAEEKRGVIRWLRPEFQNPVAQEMGAVGKAKTQPTTQDELDVDTEEAAGVAIAKSTDRLPWPKDLTDQVKAIADLLSASRVPLSEADIAARFAGRGPWKKRLPMILEMLVAVGRARTIKGGYIGA